MENDMLQKRNNPFPKVLPLFAEYYQDGKTDMAEEIIIPMMPMMELPLRQLEHKS